MKNPRVSKTKLLAVAASISALTVSCLFDKDKKTVEGHHHINHLYVAHEGTLNAWDMEDGDEMAGFITNVTGPTDMQALGNGHVLVNLTTTNEVLAFDGKTMLEIARIPTHKAGSMAIRPVHSYITPIDGITGKQYWMALNDGATTANTPAANSAFFIDISDSTDKVNYLKATGEIGLGIGHHKAAFSKTKQRVLISNISDTNKVFAVIDYSDLANIKETKSWSQDDLGVKFAFPHGCATSGKSGHAYCTMTGNGGVVSVDIDAAIPTAKVIKTTGSGGGYTYGHGQYVYALQSSPREGSAIKPGSPCQVGQIAVIDATLDSVVAYVALKNGGPTCTTSILNATDSTTGPGHILIAGSKMFVQLASGAGAATSASKHLVLDITNPALPVLTAGLDIGKSVSHHGEALSGNEETGISSYFFVTNNSDGTVTQIDPTLGTVMATITVKANPRTVATWHQHDGPSHQTGPVE